MELRRGAVAIKLERLHISAFLGIAAVIWWVVLLSQGTHSSIAHAAPFGTVVGSLVVLGSLFESRLWRWPRLHGWFVRRPDLRGTWRVELQSDWTDPETQRPGPTIICYMGVVQTLSTLQMHLMTSESESWLIAERVNPSPSAVGYEIAGVYRNKPEIHLRGERSEIHLGGLLLETHGPANRPDALTGEYWTDRKTKGRLTLTERLPEVYTRFEDADRALSED